MPLIVHEHKTVILIAVATDAEDASIQLQIGGEREFGGGQRAGRNGAALQIGPWSSVEAKAGVATVIIPAMPTNKVRKTRVPSYNAPMQHPNQPRGA